MDVGCCVKANNAVQHIEALLLAVQPKPLECEVCVYVCVVRDSGPWRARRALMSLHRLPLRVPIWPGQRCMGLGSSEEEPVQERGAGILGSAGRPVGLGEPGPSV